MRSLPFRFYGTTKKVDTHTFVSVYFHFTGAEAEIILLPLFSHTETRKGVALRYAPAQIAV
jgi:hypothetical protein